MAGPAVFWLVHVDAGVVPALPPFAVDAAVSARLWDAMRHPDPPPMEVRTISGAVMRLRPDTVLVLEESTPGSRDWQEQQDAAERRRREGWGGD